jgi:signal transduction histidine kinase/CheY-like chemotaxis protein
MPGSRNELNWFSTNLIDVLPAAVYVCNSAAVIVAYNKRATELWGRAPNLDDTDEKYCGAHKLFRPDGSYLPHPETPMECVLRTGTPARDQEVIIERPDGSRVTVLVNIAPLFDASGKQIGAVNCFQDLSAQKQSEREREQLREDLRQSQKLEALGQLLGGVAHDFNNLLTPIIGSLDMLDRRGARDDREQRLMEGALQSADRAKALVQRLLAFAHRQPLQLLDVDVGSLVTGMVDLIATTAGPQIKLIVDVAPKLPLAKADFHQLEMALLNLVINARDAMPDGGTLTISLASETLLSGHQSKLAPGRYVRLSIADTGAGMDKETVARALEPFFSTKGNGKGTGLGLSIVDGLMSQCGGALALKSELGLGTNVELWLPMSAELSESAEPTLAAAAEPKAVGRVLLVEDEDFVRISTADMLSDCGYEVVEAASAEEALALLERELPVDFLVTDHLMTGMTGVDLAHAVRERRPGTLVLILSGFSEADAIAPDLPRLLKPFRQSELSASLADLARTASN